MKNFKVITINGVRGLIVAIFVVIGLIAGFVISPGWVCMKVWNYVFEYSTTVSQMHLLQGVMLWLIIALSLYALNNRRSLIGFGSYQGLNPEQIKDIVERAKKNEKLFMKELEDKIKASELPENTNQNQQIVADNISVNESEQENKEEIKEEVHN